tara:strand:+ start:697 stop:900 length:204 start_codon:yes stop_codon:yes gene_type:complete
MRLFCEDRNQFYVGTSDQDVTLWDKDKKKAIKYTSLNLINHDLAELKEHIILHEHIYIVENSFDAHD